MLVNKFIRQSIALFICLCPTLPYLSVFRIDFMKIFFFVWLQRRNRIPPISCPISASVLFVCLFALLVLYLRKLRRSNKMARIFFSPFAQNKNKTRSRVRIRDTEDNVKKKKIQRKMNSLRRRRERKKKIGKHVPLMNAAEDTNESYKLPSHYDNKSNRERKKQRQKQKPPQLTTLDTPRHHWRNTRARALSLSCQSVAAIRVGSGCFSSSIFLFHLFTRRVIILFFFCFPISSACLFLD